MSKEKNDVIKNKDGRSGVDSTSNIIKSRIYKLLRNYCTLDENSTRDETFEDEFRSYDSRAIEVSNVCKFEEDISRGCGSHDWDITSSRRRTGEVAE